MKKWHILAYDIREEKRLRKVHYFLKKRGIALQKSIFLLHCSAEDLSLILQGVRERANIREDDIRLYPVSSPHSIWAAGKQQQALSDLYGGDDKSSKSESWLQKAIGSLFG